ncbi:MAG: HK97 family phage prohead protease [Acidobacteria bacterium]|nr:HK97 family phage prohead protease [Acidobacteriota bacterium]
MMNHKEIRYQQAKELRVQPNADGSKTISGYCIVYNSPSTDLGGFTEIVAPGAVTASLANNPDVLCLRDHTLTILLGRTTSGTLTLVEDSIGVRFSCKLPNTTQAADVAELIRRGDISGMSFGFVTLEDSWANAGDKLVRSLLKVNLYEISVVSLPAYDATSVSMRSVPDSVRQKLANTKNADATADAERYRRYMKLKLDSLRITAQRTR